MKRSGGKPGKTGDVGLRASAQAYITLLDSHFGLVSDVAFVKLFVYRRNSTTVNAKMDKMPRREHQPIRVWCLPEEKAQIEANARDAGLSVSRYLRSVGMGYKITGVIDAQLVLQLAKINGDQGRLGGLLKLWLTNSEKLASEDPDHMRRVIHGVLDRIATTQSAMLEIARKV